jgi:hypothetical protein
MNEGNPELHSNEKESAHPIRLPGFITEEDIGLGDVIKQATTKAGIRPCGGCEQRAARLNRWVVFTGRRSS